MELTTTEADLFAAYLAPFTALAGDKRTATLIGDTVRGIIASESLCCSRIAVFSPGLAAGKHSEKRVRRMVRGETTTRAPFDADAILARLTTRGVAQLRDEAAVWVILDGSDLRKPYASAMAGLQPVKRLAGRGIRPEGTRRGIEV